MSCILRIKRRPVSRFTPPPDRRDRELWACWTLPPEPLPREALVLSFLSPSDEDALRRQAADRLHSGRELSGQARRDARRLYLDVVSRIGLIPAGGGQTFRQRLARPGKSSQWWYHPVAFRGCETDPTFNRMIAVRTIQSLANAHGVRRVVLVGAPPDLAAVLRSAFIVEERSPQRSEPGWRTWAAGIGSRLRYAIRTWRQLSEVRRRAPRPSGGFDVVLSGFWDWSVWWDQQAQGLVDRYLKRLPAVLQQRAGGAVGWFLWVDPHPEPGKPRRTLAELLTPLSGRQDAVVLQAWLTRSDVVRAVMDLSPVRLFLRLRRQPALAAAFQDGALNYGPLFSGRLLRGLLDASLPHRELVALAVSRACRRYQPAVSISFLEHFPFSRAYYEGVRRAGGRTVCCAVQHASYSHEKTFMFLDPEREWQGAPDGCAVPHPDLVCAMGTLGQELFRECGYPSERVLLTGSPRYDHVAAPASTAGAPSRDGLSLLLALGLASELELEMVDAVCAAVRGLDGVRVLLRNHPFSRIEQQPGFARYRDQVALTHGSLAEDLEQADIVLFTYSTVAEEAVLGGKPVWQWVPMGFNGSALAEAVAIPQLGSVEALRRALVAFRADPASFLPTASVRNTALERLFYRGDGQGAERVADVVERLLRQARRPGAMVVA